MTELTWWEHNGVKEEPLNLVYKKSSRYLDRRFKVNRGWVLRNPVNEFYLKTMFKSLSEPLVLKI